MLAKGDHVISEDKLFSAKNTHNSNAQYDSHSHDLVTLCEHSLRKVKEEFLWDYKGEMCYGFSLKVVKQ